MNRLEQLQVSITSVPDEYRTPRGVMERLLAQGDLYELRAYSQGLRDMALHLTSDDALLFHLTTIYEVLR